MPMSIHEEWPNYGGELDPVVWARVRASMNHEEGDRVPIWDYIDNRAVVNHFMEPGDPYEQVMVRVYHGLGIDFCRGYGSSYDEADDGHENEEHTSKVSGRTAWVTKYPIESYEDLASYHPDLLDDEQCENWVQGTKAMQQRMAPLTYCVPGGPVGFHEVYGLMGQVFFSYAIYDARKDLDRLFDIMGHNAVRLAETAAKAKLGPLYFTWADIAYKGTLLYSPQFLRETFIPMLRRVCEPLNDAGIKPIFHSDGNVMEILDDMVDAGIQGLNPIETIAGMDVGLIKRRYGKRLILVGGVDCSQVLPLGSVQDIVEVTKQCLRDGGRGGGLFIGSTSEIVPATPLENVLAFFEACRTYGRYPLTI